MNTIILNQKKKRDDKKYTAGQFFKSLSDKLYLLAQVDSGVHKLICVESNDANRCGDESNPKRYFTLGELSKFAGEDIYPVDVTITEIK